MYQNFKFRFPQVVSLLLLSAGMLSASAQLVISNATTQVTFSPATGLFSVFDFASGRTFVPQGNFNETNGAAAVVAVTNAAFGAGKAIQFSHPDGNSDTILLFTNLPFALFQSTLTNATAQTGLSNHIHTLTAQVDLGEPTANLKALGTGGLTTPAGNPGSYAWLAVADPTNRNGVVGGWLTSDRGSGIVFGKVNGTLVQVDAQIDYGRLQFLPGQTNLLELFAVGYFPDARIGLETWAGSVAQVYNIHLNPQPDGYCTYPSSPNGGASSPAAVAQLSDFVKTNLEAFGFSMIQIDAGWQAGITSTNGSNHGPTRVFTAYTNNYSAGVKPTADYLLADGITPGIWFEPFAGTSDDPYFTNHEDWFVETTNGTPYWCEWGGNSLDMTYPPARTYVSNMVSNLTYGWDYMYFKMDGFWTGSATPLKYVNAGYSADTMGDAVFYNPAKPNIEAFRDGIKLVRQAAGTNVFFDGCNIAQNMRSYSGSFGLLDAMRVGPDNSSSWGTSAGTGSGWLRSPLFGTRHYFLQGRIWYNDPDTAYVRSSFTLSQAQTVVAWYAISGQLFLDGDWIPGLTPDRLDLLKRALPHHGLLPRPVDYFENDPPNIWLLTQPATNNAPRRDVVGLFNWNAGANLNINVTLAHLGLATNVNYVGFDFWSNSVIPTIGGSLALAVQPGASEIIALRPQSGVPELISTSRHITQGVVDVLAEQWDGASTLSGTSKLVGGDLYELRIVSTNDWRLKTASVSAADQAAGVTVVSSNQISGLTRVTLLSPTNRSVNWSISFTPGPTVTLTSPTNAQIFYTNSLIPLSAIASDPIGSITKVDFYNGAANVGTVSNAPYNLTISNLALGTYNLSAVATDNGGNTGTSAVVQVQVQLLVPFTLAVSPASQTVVPGAATNYTVTVAVSNSFSGPVALGISGLPPLVGAAFSPSSVTGGGSSTLTLTASNGISSGTYNLTAIGASGVLTNTAGLTLVVNGTANLRWNPGANGVWDVTNTANWFNTGSGLNDVFHPGDNVLFDDSGSAQTGVTIGSGIAVAPGSLIVSADVNNYSVSGAGKITGATGIEKDGAASLLLATANDFTGPVVINYGTLIAGNAAALGGTGSSTTVNPGGTLDVGGFNLTAEPVTLSGQGANNSGAVVNSGAAQVSALRQVTLAGDVTFGGANRWDIRNTGGTANLSTTPPGSAFNITKVGLNQVSLVGVTTIESTLGNIDIQQGEFAIQTTTVQVGDSSKTITVHGGATLEVWALTAGPLNKQIVLNDGATFFSESGSSTVAGPVTLQGNDTFNIAGTSATFNNVIAGPGNLNKTGGSALYLSGVNTYTGNTTVSNGTLYLTGTGSISNSAVITVIAAKTLDASARSDATLSLAAGQKLTGSGTVNGNVVAGDGATLAPGGALSTLNFNNNLTLNGGSTTVMEISKSSGITNDLARVAGNLVYGGTLAVTNIGAVPYAAGDSFLLFAAAGYSEAFTNVVPAIPAVNLAWNTNGLGTGVLSVVASPTPPPVFNRAKASGSNLVFSGTNGVRGWPYFILTSTNLAVPWVNWTRTATGYFDPGGNFQFTNAASTNAPQSFYRLQLQ